MFRSLLSFTGSAPGGASSPPCSVVNVSSVFVSVLLSFHFSCVIKRLFSGTLQGVLYQCVVVNFVCLMHKGVDFLKVVCG